MRVNRQRVINALEWLVKHNPFYKDVRITNKNFDWMQGQTEANIARTGVNLTMVETNNDKKHKKRMSMYLHLIGTYNMMMTMI